MMWLFHSDITVVASFMDFRAFMTSSALGTSVSLGVQMSDSVLLTWLGQSSDADRRLTFWKPTISDHLKGITPPGAAVSFQFVTWKIKQLLAVLALCMSTHSLGSLFLMYH